MQTKRNINSPLLLRLQIQKVILKQITSFNNEHYEIIKQIVEGFEEENCEIRFTWYQIALKFNDSTIIENIRKFLKSVGRMKFVRPVFREFYNFNKEECVKFYNENKVIYHSVARMTLEKILV